MLRIVRALAILVALAAAPAMAQTNWPEKPEYVAASPTVMTVSEKAGTAVLHMPEPIYPEQALRESVEGTVKLKVVVNDEGMAVNVTPVSGPELLRAAAVDAVHRWQFEGKEAETHHIKVMRRGANKGRCPNVPTDCSSGRCPGTLRPDRSPPS